MKIINILKKEVEKTFSTIMKKYSLTLLNLDSEQDNKTVYLLGKNYALSINVDPYGLTYSYYNLNEKKENAYDLWCYLVSKREKDLVLIENDVSNLKLLELLPIDLSNFAVNLEMAGQDILEGDKAWLKQYTWPTGTMSEDVYSELMEIIKAEA